MTGCTRSRRQSHSGFSLIELSVVLVIIGLLVGGGITALEATQTQALRSDQQRQLEQVRTALYGFAMSEGRLPCPSGSDDNGKEGYDPVSERCENDLILNEVARGRLPWADLGLGRRDAWGYPLRYVVTAGYADASSFDSDTPRKIVIHDDHSDADPAVDPDEELAVPAVVISFGPQGGQVWQASGYTCPGEDASAAGFSQNETENCSYYPHHQFGYNPNQFVETGFSSSESGRRFDDMLIWPSDAVLTAHMFRSGQWP